MKKLLMTILVACALTSCSGNTDYNAEKCEELITTVNQAKQINDVTKEQWRELYSQYMSLDGMLRSQILKLLSTPWSSTKENNIHELLDSKEIAHWRMLSILLSPISNNGFPASAYFTETEVADMRSAADATMLELNNLLAQADLDGK